jgi:hypothetical protein
MGLFAATIGTLLTISILDLKLNLQDTSTFYLENIYQLLANPNTSDAMIQSTLAKAPAFSPPRYVIWVNSLWFLSLAISLLGTIVAMLGQQWAYCYITAIWGASLMPLYLHVSFFLFLASGLIYLLHLN